MITVTAVRLTRTVGDVQICYSNWKLTYEAWALPGKPWLERIISALSVTLREAKEARHPAEASEILGRSGLCPELAQGAND